MPSASRDPHHLVVVGSLNLDLLLHVPHLPTPGETQLASTYTTQPGGKGANQAVAAARLGAPTSMLGCVGNDDAAQLLRTTLQQAGVAIDAIASCDQPTGTAAILLTPQGDNSIIVAAGANHALTPTHLQQHAALLRSAAIILTQLETPLPVLEALLHLAAEAGIPVMLDPAPAALLPPQLLQFTTWFTPNETEARFYINADFPAAINEITAHQLCRHLQALGPRNILLKLGSQGAAILTADSKWFFVPAPHVHAVDTTGAGDTLNAAFATALLRGLTPPAALHCAVAAASLSVTRPGAMASSPTSTELTVYLDTRLDPGP